MTRLSFLDFIDGLMSKGRIGASDVQRLQRDLLPNGLESREEAERLFDLERSVVKADPAWSRWLVSTTVDFVVWGERPTGVVDEDTARWLAAQLTGGASAPTKTGRSIAREIAQEAQAFENEALSALASIGRAPRSKPAVPQRVAPAFLSA